MIKNVLYISVWNGGIEVATNAKFNEHNNEVFDIEMFDGELIDEDGDVLEFLDGEFIEFVDGNRYNVIEKQDKFYADLKR